KRTIPLQQDDLGRRDEPVEGLAAFRNIEVDDDALLARVEEDETGVEIVAGSALPPVGQALRRLHANDLGTQIGEQAACIGAQPPSQVDDAHTGIGLIVRSHFRSPFLPRRATSYAAERAPSRDREA